MSYVIAVAGAAILIAILRAAGVFKSPGRLAQIEGLEVHEGVSGVLGPGALSVYNDETPIPVYLRQTQEALE